MTSELIAGVAGGLKNIEGGAGFDVLVCPPNPYLCTAQRSIAGTGIQLGAQNVSDQTEGAFTGEVSLPMLSEFNCNYVLLGHSERRELFYESNEQVASKFAACVKSDTNIRPILCIGETLEQRQSSETEVVIDKQIDAVLEVVGINGFVNAVIAYEPVWAIGTGETASPEQAQKAHKYIRNKLTALDSRNC